MRILAMALGLAVAACGATPQDAYDLGDEAQAEAERANSRVSDVEVELETLRQLVDEKDARIDDLEGLIRENAADDETNFNTLNAVIDALERQQRFGY